VLLVELESLDESKGLLDGSSDGKVVDGDPGKNEEGGGGW